MVVATNPYAPPAVPATSPLQRDVLKVLLYFDLFRHPLSSEEIYEFLPSNSTTPSNVARACSSLPLNMVVDFSGGFFFLKERGAGCVAERRNKEATAQRRWRIARFMTKLIRHFPFVRGVGISGELSKGVSSEEGDIDYVLITEQGRLWISRTLLILFKKIVLMNSKKFFCLNHFVSRDRLEVERRDLYVAMELATVKPVVNPWLFERYLEANPWIEAYLPNWWKKFSKSRQRILAGAAVDRSLLQKLLELPFQGAWGKRLDEQLMRSWQALWKRRYPGLNDEARARLFTVTPSLSTAYGGDFLTSILARYREQLRRYDLLEESFPAEEGFHG